MIEFVLTSKRKYDVFRKDGDQEKLIAQLDLQFSPVTNKFDKLTDFVEDCSRRMGTEFDDWFDTFLTEYQNSQFDHQIVKQNVPRLREFADRYLELCEINFEDYINPAKISKNSIFFNAPDIKKIIQVANYLKIYFIISQDLRMKLSNRFHKEVYNDLVSPLTETNIVYKLFKIVSSKTYEYNHTDKYMWDYIKTMYCKTTHMHIVSIFNFLVNNILVTCQTDSNPIPYMISVIDESIKWILKNSYNEAIVYSDTIATQDVYTIQGRDNLSSYAHNDTIGRLLISAYNRLEENGIEDIEAFKNTIGALREISLFANYITYPILSKVLDIPYRHFLTIPVGNSYLLNLLVYHYLPESFKEEYPTISRMLLYYNTEKPILKTTYKIKNVQEFLGSLGSFLGFKNNNTPYEIYSTIIGKLSRNTYVSFLNYKDIGNFPLAKLEEDVIKFYNAYFDDRLEPTFREIEKAIDETL